jgi:XTP/dITP diphosphohydrolase
VVATRNPHKVREVARILGEQGLDVELIDLATLAERYQLTVPEVPETELTFEGNAIVKARSVAQVAALPAIADDSGLCVDALNGMPGPLSARWAGRHGDDQANLALVLDQIADLPDEARSAQFVCAAALALPDGRVEVVTGRLEGHLARQPRGTNGFGYDPIFIPEGETRSTAEMAPEEKDAISHRGKAFRALAPIIARLVTR